MNNTLNDLLRLLKFGFIFGFNETNNWQCSVSVTLTESTESVLDLMCKQIVLSSPNTNCSYFM